MSSETENLKRWLERERKARKAAEQIAEEKTRELFVANKALQGFNDHLEETIQIRTRELEQARDAARKASTIKSRFLANMSHELRTPLNAIIGYSEILQEEVEDLDQDCLIPDLQKIQSSGMHLLSIVNDILDLSKIEEGMLKLDPEHFYLQELVKEVVSNLMPMMKKNGNEVTVDCPPSIGEVYNDLIRVRQVLYNLLSNASKFTSGGIVQVTVEEGSIHDHRAIRMLVRDTGIGMSAAQAASIFDLFTQADESTTRDYGGTGLGLTISRRLCRKMGGDLTVESVEDEGSTFSALILADAHVLDEITEPELDDLSFTPVPFEISS